MPHEAFYAKNKNRKERRQINLLHKNRHKVLRALKKHRTATEQLNLVMPPRVKKARINLQEFG